MTRRSGIETWIVSLALISVLIAAAAFISAQQGSSDLELRGDAGVTSRNQDVNIGGVRRPLSDIRGLDRQEGERDSASLLEDDLAADSIRYPYGTTPHISRDLNPSVALAAEALSSPNKESPERLSAVIQPAEFDPVLYEANKQGYLDQSVPGRVWQTAQPADGVPILGAVGQTQHKMLQGEAVRLQVRTAPNAPVTFTSFDLGAFSNGLTSITIEADDSGLASAVFTAPGGTAYAVNLLAASPMATGQVRFRVFVVPPANATGN